MVVLIFGPSGVGKTTACEAVRGRFPKWVFRHLDGLASDYAFNRGWVDEASVSRVRAFARNDDLFLAIGLQAIADLDARSQGTHLIIDVGAGFQDATYARILPRLYPSIAVIATVAAAYERRKLRKEESRTEEGYGCAEFSPSRAQLYDNCRPIIDTTGLSAAEAADRLAEALGVTLTGR